MIVTDDAHVYEEVPPERLTAAAMKRRALRRGQCYARFRMARDAGRGWRRLLFFGEAAAATAVGHLLSVGLRPFNHAASFRWRMRAWWNSGKLRRGLGLTVIEMDSSPGPGSRK
jgi:hypothetical protein